MNKNTIVVAAVLALSAGLSALLWAAQEGPKGGAGVQRRKPPALDERVKMQTAMLAGRLELTDEQQEAIGKLLLEKEKKVEKLDKEKRVIEAEANEKIRALLKVEQRDDYEEMRLMLRRGAGMHGGPAGGGPRFGGAHAMGPRPPMHGGPEGFSQQPGGFGEGGGAGEPGGFGGPGGFGPRRGGRPPQAPFGPRDGAGPEGLED